MTPRSCVSTSLSQLSIPHFYRRWYSKMSFLWCFSSNFHLVYGGWHLWRWIVVWSAKCHVHIRVTLKIKDQEFHSPHRIQHILGQFHYTTMQKLCNFKALYKPQIQYKCHKDTLDNALLLVGCGRFMIFHIKGHSSTYIYERSKNSWAHTVVPILYFFTTS